MTEYSVEIQFSGDVRYIRTSQFRMDGKTLFVGVEGKDWPVGAKANLIGSGCEYRDECCVPFCYITFVGVTLESVTRTLGGHSLCFRLT